MHTAVVSGSTQTCDVIHALLDNGADINAQTRGEEDTVLHLVVENGDFPGDFSLVIMLLENNVDLSVRNRVSGWLPGFGFIVPLAYIPGVTLVGTFFLFFLRSSIRMNRF